MRENLGVQVVMWLPLSSATPRTDSILLALNQRQSERTKVESLEIHFIFLKRIYCNREKVTSIEPNSILNTIKKSGDRWMENY